jgi:hypothetical protein
MCAPAVTHPEEGAIEKLRSNGIFDAYPDLLVCSQLATTVSDQHPNYV